MAEATEIAKLRLFLKMVAVVDVQPLADNLGLDPLPDIDFNIRCGNTLVGYANAESIVRDHSGDMFAKHDFEENVAGEMDKVARTFKLFKHLQLTQESENHEEFIAAKRQLRDLLTSLNDTLNHHLHNATAVGIPYEEWLTSRQPFNWIAEFYDIIHGNGGFDVIIGNPPYVTQKKKQLEEINLPAIVVKSGNLYSAIIHRSRIILSPNAYYGMIVPISYISTSDHKDVRNFVEKDHLNCYSSYDIRPAHLFDGAAQRLTIFINAPFDKTVLMSERQLRWYSDTRGNLFNCISYSFVCDSDTGLYRTSPLSFPIIETILCQKRLDVFSNPSEVWMATTANNFIKGIVNQPHYSSNSVEMEPSGWRTLYFNKCHIDEIIPIINSSTFYFFWKCSSDGFNVTKGFTNDLVSLMTFDSPHLRSLSSKLLTALEVNSETHVRNQKTTGRTEIQLFRVKPVKPIIDEIDKVLARHYGFTEEELDFIINYDIKYRMGDELNNEE